MFSPCIIAALFSLNSVAFALPKADGEAETKSINPSCWLGNIHSACDGHQNGCTPDGIYVTCQSNPNGDAMVYSSMCTPAGSPPGTLPGTCHCDDSTGNSSC